MRGDVGAVVAAAGLGHRGGRGHHRQHRLPGLHRPELDRLQQQLDELLHRPVPLDQLSPPRRSRVIIGGGHERRDHLDRRRQLLARHHPLDLVPHLRQRHQPVRGRLRRAHQDLHRRGHMPRRRPQLGQGPQLLGFPGPFRLGQQVRGDQQVQHVQRVVD
ncbi:diadenosine tetraphosphatase ApaH/serine/threonine PP2A family protein phosphatase [Actinomadura viridis]|uniref:Diadenosine tetraphosphatase ApaH/serine/threonine PP2A family protein phosphatase n=1 Tax=Actinomadura viridis TaxID=58110 RepID=A0A931DIX8_9ACTN|nr:diadenosine tetraphosphatase ApaH/serine/threonine PP2A family protein phosphatase [Actinomadura viridis]